MPVVELAGVTKAYESKVAVRDLSLSIEAGQMFGLLGPNGAGKTSSIRMMMGITLPDSGRIRSVRKTLRSQEPRSRGLSARGARPLQEDECARAARLLRPAARRRRRRMPASAPWTGPSRMEISDALEKKTQELSKGMQQKIQFIATLLHDPDLIVMDEPFSGLDPVNATLLQDALLELKARGKAILFSTHRMDQVEKLCDAICLVDHGEAVLSGSMREIKSRYERNHVIVEFEGSADFLKSDEIAEANNYSGHAEIKLKPHGDAQKLLHEAASMAAIYPL